MRCGQIFTPDKLPDGRREEGLIWLKTYAWRVLRLSLAAEMILDMISGLCGRTFQVGRAGQANPLGTSRLFSRHVNFYLDFCFRLSTQVRIHTVLFLSLGISSYASLFLYYLVGARRSSPKSRGRQYHTSTTLYRSTSDHCRTLPEKINSLSW